MYKIKYSYYTPEGEDDCCGKMFWYDLHPICEFPSRYKAEKFIKTLHLSRDRYKIVKIK